MKLTSLLDGIEVVLLPVKILRGHEQVIEKHVEELRESIIDRGYEGPPILVEKSHNIILDGHHRVEALKRLHVSYVPAIYIDYNSELIHLTSWRPGIELTRSEVIRRALMRKPFPPKTTRHIVKASIPLVKASLESLKSGDTRGVIVVK